MLTSQNTVLFKGFFVVGFSLTAVTAYGHAHLKTSVPAESEVLHDAPKEIDIVFTEDLEPSMSKIEVKDLESGDLVSEGKVGTGKEGKKSLKVSLKSLKAKKSKFEVSWRATSTDTHHMEGKYTFEYNPSKA